MSNHRKKKTTLFLDVICGEMTILKKDKKRTCPAVGASQRQQAERQDPRELLAWGASGRSQVLQWCCLRAGL